MKRVIHAMKIAEVSAVDRPAREQMDAQAAELRKTETSLTKEQAFEKVYTDPANRDLVKTHKQERDAAIHGEKTRLPGLGGTTPLNSISPLFLTASTACGVKIGLLSSPTRGVAIKVPFGLRSLLAIGPGPDSGGSKKNQLRPHIPDKSGIDPEGAAVCPKAAAHPKSAMPVKSISLLYRFTISSRPVCPREFADLN